MKRAGGVPYGLRGIGQIESEDRRTPPVVVVSGMFLGPTPWCIRPFNPRAVQELTNATDDLRRRLDGSGSDVDFREELREVDWLVSVITALSASLLQSRW